MASNHQRWVGNMYGHDRPLIMLGKFAAGASVPIKRGELLELTGNTNTEWVPMDSDYNMAANVAIANEEIKNGDLAGYYEIIVPRDGDMFEYDLAAAGSNAVGTAVYWSSSEAVTITAGSNIIGNIVGQEHYPQKQGHLSDDASTDSGTSIRSVSKAIITIQRSNSYLAALQTA